MAVDFADEPLAPDQRTGRDDDLVVLDETLGHADDLLFATETLHERHFRRRQGDDFAVCTKQTLEAEQPPHFRLEQLNLLRNHEDVPREKREFFQAPLVVSLYFSLRQRDENLLRRFRADHPFALLLHVKFVARPDLHDIPHVRPPLLEKEKAW